MARLPTVIDLLIFRWISLYNLCCTYWIFWDKFSCAALHCGLYIVARFWPKSNISSSVLIEGRKNLVSDKQSKKCLIQHIPAVHLVYLQTARTVLQHARYVPIIHPFSTWSLFISTNIKTFTSHGEILNKLKRKEDKKKDIVDKSLIRFYNIFTIVLNWLHSSNYIVLR